MKLRLVIAASLILMVWTGCATQLRNRELEQVAKDWSMVIRASQVIPVYPLTEDLQPGDIFLVQLPIDRQHEIYTQRGFLPLDNMIHRINPTGYKRFYEKSFDAGDSDKPLPKHWLTPGKPEAWSEAPYASFPTYSFSVRSGGGFNLALPVQGVPVGLSLMGGDAEQGTVTIADAHTYGVDTVSLRRDVLVWARDNRTFLRNFAPEGDKQNYLRIVSRVYLTGRLNISLQSSRSLGAAVSGGAPKPVDLVVPSPGSDPQEVTLKSYEKNVEALNKMLEEGLKKIKLADVDRFLPGATVKVVSASAGSISLLETFNRPVVIGYLGFDMAIGPGGVLGPPIPTHAVLEKQVVQLTYLRTGEFVEEERQNRVEQILDTIDKLSPERAFELNKQVPVRNEEVEEIVALRDPEGKRLADVRVAKEMLKMRIILGKRSDVELNAWEKALKGVE
ncbi:MAG: hypothetical protein GTN74_10485 [Proteobacteria bacterium]|nr:hypothetical protein [Pseudomonadota bacterium]NIS70571.1 hypothetical protein [Pseudomonadota bacterium]